MLLSRISRRLLRVDEPRLRVVFLHTAYVHMMTPFSFAGRRTCSACLLVGERPRRGALAGRVFTAVVVVASKERDRERARGTRREFRPRAENKNPSKIPILDLAPHTSLRVLLHAPLPHNNHPRPCCPLIVSIYLLHAHGGGTRQATERERRENGERERERTAAAASVLVVPD